MTHFTTDIDSDGIALVTFDSPGRSMNVLSPEVVAEYTAVVERICTDDAITGAVFTSGKEAFCAGADLEAMFAMLSGIRSNPNEAKARRDVFEVIYATSHTMRKLETCGKPIAAAVNGLALGGGFEMTLACHVRFVADDNPKLKLGLPEAMIGLLPGWGGTQRLPRIMGLMNVAPYLMQGKTFKAKDAVAQGVALAAVPTKDLVATAKQWVKDNPKAKAPWDMPKFRFPGGLPFTPKGLPMFGGANAMIRKESYGNYPSMGNILKCVYEGSQLPMDTALRVEGRYFTDLLFRPESGNMVRTLFLSKQAIEKGAARPAGQVAGQINKIGVIGAGFMGAGVAYVSARAGIEVVLIDRDQESADKGKAFTAEQGAKGVKRGKVSQEKADEVTNRITATADYNLLKGVDLIVEAVYENSELKNKITKMAEEIIGDTAIMGTNTSTIPISDLANASSRPDNFIGIHFFSPVHKMMLVEIIRGKKTSDYAISRALDFVMRIRKVPIVVEDTRSFYANRCVFRFINEGLNMLVEGVKPALIENAAKMAGMPVGPLSLTDEIAIDLSYKILQQTKLDLGDDFEPQKGDSVIEHMYKAERFGRKNSKGFYDYEGRNKKLWPELGQFTKAIQDPQPNVQDVKDRILYAQALEAARTMAEEIVHDPREADLGSIFGWGFPPFTGGAISFIDTIGTAAFVARAKELEEAYGDQFKVPALLNEMAKTGETFYARFGKTDSKSYTKTELNKMLEKDVVALANKMGISATVDDLKKDTVAKILAKQA